MQSQDDSMIASSTWAARGHQLAILLDSLASPGTRHSDVMDATGGALA